MLRNRAFIDVTVPVWGRPDQNWALDCAFMPPLARFRRLGEPRRSQANHQKPSLLSRLRR
jgi:hypothetical protein